MEIQMAHSEDLIIRMFAVIENIILWIDSPIRLVPIIFTSFESMELRQLASHI